MEEKQEHCRRCHGEHLHPTLNPNEFKCNYCGWTKIGKVGLWDAIDWPHFVTNPYQYQTCVEGKS